MFEELKYASRALLKARGLTVTVVLTLALGIGVNAAIVNLVRSVLLRPLVNRSEDRIVYLRQSAPGIGSANMTFSVPEIQDLRSRVGSLEDVAEFSTLTFTMVGLGEPRQVRAGVVSGNYFDVMGLRPAVGRLLTAADDGGAAAGAAVLTHRFWTGTLNADPTVIGKTIRLDTRSAEIVGVLEPAVPYPTETEVIANIVTSPHHLSATMITGREHRMTEVFGRMRASATLPATLAEVSSAYQSIRRDFAEAYPERAAFTVRGVLLRDQLTSNARTVLIVLALAALLIFVIACANVANLVLARTVRRESELAVRAALGADDRTLRRTLLAESLLLCGVGGLLGVALAWPMTSVLARYAARFSARAVDVSVDPTLVLTGLVLSLLAALLLAYIPRLPSLRDAGGLRVASSVRVTGGTRRKLHLFAVTQVGASFVLIAGAVMLVRTLVALQSASPGFDVAKVLAVNVPVTSYGRTPDQTRTFYRLLRERVGAIPGVDQVAIGSAVPWRDGGQFDRGGFAFQIEGGVRGDTRDDPRGKFRSISPGYFAALGVPMRGGRDFGPEDRSDTERVVIVSESVAARLFPGGDVLNRRLVWTDPVMKFINVDPAPRRIVGVVPDIDDEHIVPGASLTVYHPFEQQVNGGRVFVHTRSEPYALVPPITRIVRELSVDQPVERAATLQDIRTEVLTPDRLNTAVFGLFAIVALAIAIVGVAGVLAFSVGGRTREFGIKLALGLVPEKILFGVLGSGAAIAVAGIVLGIGAGYAAARVAAAYLSGIQMPGVVAGIAAAAVLLVAAIVASIVPAARAARTNVMDALRAE